MSIEMIVLKKDDVNRVQDFVPEDVYENLCSKSSYYALCAIDEDDILGTAVFETRTYIMVHSIYVPEENPEEINKELLTAIVRMGEQLKCSGVIFEVFDEDNPLVWYDYLAEEGVEHEKYTPFYRFTLEELINNPHLVKINPGKEVVSLSEVSDKQKREFSNVLIRKKGYDRFMDDLFDKEISSVYVEDLKIKGCVLVSIDDEEGAFTLEYVNTNGCSDSLAFLKMLKYSADRVSLRFGDPDTYGTGVEGNVIAMNDVSEKLIQKIIPQAECYDHCNTFVRIIEKDESAR